MSPASNPIQNNHSALPNGHTPNSHYNPSSQPMMNGNHQPRNAINTNGTDHQWYMRDSMKPIDATQHGGKGGVSLLLCPLFIPVILMLDSGLLIGILIFPDRPIWLVFPRLSPAFERSINRLKF